MRKLICKIFGHKKFYNIDWRPKPSGDYVEWWCERCNIESIKVEHKR